MENHAEAIEVALPNRDTLHIRDGEGLTIEVIEGCLWLTQERDTKDYMVEAGQSIALDRPGLTLAAAHRSARLRLRNSGATCNASIEIGGQSAHGAGNARSSRSVPERLRAAASVLLRNITIAKPALR